MNTLTIGLKRFFGTLALAALLIPAMAQAQSYTIEATPNNASYGTVTGSGDYTSGQTVTLTATPADGYEFVSWRVGRTVVSSDNPWSFEAEEDASYTAFFRLIPQRYTLNAVVLPVASAGSVEGAGQWTAGNVYIEAVESNERYSFAGWYLDAAATMPLAYNYGLTVTLNSDTTLYALFHYQVQQRTVAVAVSPAEGGTATINGGSSATMYEGETMTLAATPASGYTFLNWAIGEQVLSTEAECSVALPVCDGNPVVTANFVNSAATYSISTSRNIDAAGVVTGGGTYTGGTTATVSATVTAQNYVFVGWVEGTDTVSREATYSFVVNRARSLQAFFRYVPPTYTITALAEPTEGGTVSGGGSYTEGSTATLTASPNEGYSFHNWTENGGTASSSTTFSFTVNSSRQLVANFVRHYAISVEASEGGTVSGGGTYNSGATATVSATPASGYAFSRWTEGGVEVSTAASYSFTVSAARSLRAEFLPQYTVSLSANPAAGGTVSGNGTYTQGSDVAITATPNTGYDFQNWTVGGVIVASTPSYTLEDISANQTLVANFSRKTYTISSVSSPTNGGSVNGTGTVQHGASVSLTPVANNGYAFAGWFENSVSLGNDVPLTFTATANRTIEAHFVEQVVTYTVNASCNPAEGGSISRSAQGPYASGSTLTLTASANQYYEFVNWTEGNTVVSTSASYSFNVAANRTLVANFNYVAPTVTVSATASPAEGGSVSGTGAYTMGEQVTLSATPSANYSFTRWTENGTQIATTSTLTFIAGSADRNFVAVFTRDVQTFTVTGIASPLEGGSVLGAGNIAEGQSITLTARPNPNYTFTRWTVNGTEVSTESQYTFTPTQNCTVVAVYTYVPPTYTVTATANPSAGGTVGGLENGNTFAESTHITLTASASDNYTFNNWTEGGTVVWTNATYSFEVTANRSLVANFTYTPNTYAVSATCDPQNSGSVTGTGSFAQGVEARLTANPNSANYEFVNWTENGLFVSAENPYVFTVSGARSLVAHFNRLASNHTVGVVVTPDGAGTASGSGEYADGQTASLIATPSNGYNFVGWYDGSQLLSTSPNFSITVSNDRTIYAVFELQAEEYEINASANPANAGYVTGFGTYAEGSSVSLRAVATNSAYHFLNWTENGRIVSRNANYSFIALANHTLVANFYTEAGEEYNISLGVNNPDGGTVSGGGFYASGEAVTLTATPASNFYFAGWSENGRIFSTATEYTFIADADRTITGVFECFCHTELVLDNGEGTISDGSGNENYLTGTNCRWLIRPAAAESVTLTFTSFQTVQGMDYVDIYDGATTAAPRLGHFSGHSLPPAVTSTSGVMLVLFTTNGTRSDAGWEAQYTSVYGDDEYLVYSDTSKTVVVGCNPTVTSVHIPGRVVKIASRAFEGCNDMVRINIPGSVDTIEDHAFYNCVSLEKVSMPASVRFLGDYAFAGCSALQSVVLPSALDTIRPYAFYNCSTLKRIEIPNTVKWIGSNAFRYCRSVYSLVVPGSVDTVESYAFANMDGLRFVTLNAGNKHFGSNAFYYNYWSSNIQLTNFNGTVADWTAISWGNEYANPMRYSHNFAIDGMVVNDLVIPEGVDSVNGYAFYSNAYINTVSFPASLDSIGAYAFYNLSGLERISLGNTETKVNVHAFDGVSNQVPVVVPCYALDSIRQTGWSIFTRFVGEGVPILTLMQRNGGLAKITSEPTCDDYTAEVLAIPGNSYNFVSWSDGSTDNPHTILLTDDDVIAPVFERKAYMVAERDLFISFETEQDVANWCMSDDGGENKWYIGNAISFEGDSALYVSNNGGVSNSYSHTNSPYAYTDLYLKEGVYELVLHWLGNGSGYYGDDKLHIALIPDGVNMSADAQGAISLTNGLNGHNDWRNFDRTANIPADGWYRLAFFWDLNLYYAYDDAPAIDNIYLEYKESWRLERMTWPVNVTVADDNAGYATGSGIYYYNDTVTIEAVANDHYRFLHWNDGNTDNPRQVLMSDYYGNDEPFVAYFELAPFQVIVDVDHDGAATVIGNGVFDLNDQDTVAVVYPQAGWAFLGWMDADDGTNAISVLDNPYYVNVDRDMHLTAIMTDLDTAYIHDTTVVVDTLYIHDTLYVVVTTSNNDSRFVQGSSDSPLVDDPRNDPSASFINVKVYTDNGQIVVEDAGNFVVRLYDINGRLLDTQQNEFAPLRFDVFNTGTYMIRIGDHVTRKIVVVK